MLLNYPALAVSLGIPNLQEHLRGFSRRKPTHSCTICDVRRACAALLVEQGYSYRAVLAVNFVAILRRSAILCAPMRNLRANNADYERVAAVIFGLHAPKVSSSLAFS